MAIDQSTATRAIVDDPRNDRLVNLAIAAAARWHEGQVDKVGVNYIYHPLRVMLAVKRDGAPSTTQAIAVLHDVVEDTAATLDDLRRWGFPADVVEAVDALSRRDGESYADYLMRLALNPYAVTVKLADIEDNQGRLPVFPMPPWASRLRERYRYAVLALKSAMTESDRRHWAERADAAHIGRRETSGSHGEVHHG